SEFFNTFVMQEAEQAAWLTMAARLATLVAYIIYRTEVKILRGVGRSIADYLPGMMRLIEALSDIEAVKDIVKRGLAELDKSTVPPSLRGAVGAAENFVKMPPFGDVYNSYVTAMSMIVSRLNTPNVDKSHDGAFLRLSRHAVREAKHLRPLKAVYIWQSDLGTAVRDVATALIQWAIALNFKLRAQLKANGVEEPPMIVFLDDFITLGYIEVMAKLPNVGRSVGMWSVVTAQTTKHLTEYGQKKENVLAAYNTVFAFSVTDADSAEYIARRVGVLEPKWKLFDKTPKSEVVARAGRVDGSILDVPPGTAILLSSRPVYKSRNVAIVRLYDPRPKPWDKLKELFRRGGT
ncbi:TraM recognition domain-containing protein, partial [Pyrobaculum sp.]|uniref:TraM recognition domain-containing protein n=1 Tax=Pyrobaculum sp. TaxID=2004705 RepID=UPI003D0FD126